MRVAADGPRKGVKRRERKGEREAGCTKKSKGKGVEGREGELGKDRGEK